MKRAVVLLCIGALAGSAGTWWLVAADGSVPGDMPRRDLEDVADMSAAEAQSHRQERYASIRSIEDILALPTDFAETEALYAVAGRATSAELQYLLQQANRIRDRQDRIAAQRILLLRLTDLDPRSALAIAGSPSFADEPGLLQFVWSSWAEIDFDAALDAAAMVPDDERRTAAEALYSAVGITGDRAAANEDRLDSAPRYTSQVDHMLQLASGSPVTVAGFVESLAPTQYRQYLVQELARFAAGRSRVDRDTYVAAFTSPSLRQSFERMLAYYQARLDPEATIREALSAADGTGESNSLSRHSLRVAIGELAARDLDAAARLLDDFRNRQDALDYLGTIEGLSAEERAQYESGIDRASGVTTSFRIMH